MILLSNGISHTGDCEPEGVICGGAHRGDLPFGVMAPDHGAAALAMLTASLKPPPPPPNRRLWPLLRMLMDTDSRGGSPHAYDAKLAAVLRLRESAAAAVDGDGDGAPPPEAATSLPAAAATVARKAAFARAWAAAKLPPPLPLEDAAADDMETGDARAVTRPVWSMMCTWAPDSSRAEAVDSWPLLWLVPLRWAAAAAFRGVPRISIEAREGVAAARRSASGEARGVSSGHSSSWASCVRSGAQMLGWGSNGWGLAAQRNGQCR